MDQSDIAKIRLTSQRLVGMKPRSCMEILSWMVAMQAQDYPMAKWAMGVRINDASDKTLEAAIDNAEIIRTHLLRPTWHFVAAEDVFWLLELTGPQIKASQRSRDKDLELTEAVYAKSNSIIEKALRAGKHLTRKELVAKLQKAGIATNQNRASHLLQRAELDEIICSGASRNSKPTYALLSDRVQKTKTLSREEALAKLAGRYFNSRCPATLQDFIWWSGLPAGDARQALELVKSDFDPASIGGATYWIPHDLSMPDQRNETAHLLPTYDEFILSYTDRSASIPLELESHLKAISDRGVFRPILVVNGQVKGIWKRTLKKDLLVVELEYFSPPDETTKALVEGSANQLGGFMGKNIEVMLNH